MFKQSLVALFSLIAFSSFADSVKIYTWEDYLSEDIIEQFEQQTGHQIIQHYFEDEITRDKILLGQYGSQYDVIVIDSYTIDAYLDAEFIYPLHQEPEYWSTHFNQGSVAACGIGGIPYTQGSMGIVYRSSQFPIAPKNYSDLFEQDFITGKKLIMPKDDVDTIAVALLALGYHPMTNNKQEIKQAYELLTQQKPNVQEYRTTYDYVLENGKASDINLAIAWSGEVQGFTERTEQADWEFVVPESGSLNWYDCFTAPTTQPISDATRAFFTFISTADAAAGNAEYLWVQSSHKEIADLISEELLNDETVYTPTSVLDNSYNYMELSRDAIQVRTRILATLLQ